MKLTAVLLTACCLQVSAYSGAQVSFSGKDVRLDVVFQAIGKQTGYIFLYSPADLKDTRPVTIDVKNVSIETIMKKCLEGQPLEFTIADKTVFVKRMKQKNTSIEVFQNVNAPPIDVRGRVINEEGEPVAGVSIMIKGTKIGTYTNGDGEFTLSKVDPGATLILTAVNIQSIEANINGRRDITVQVKGKTGKLDEVQVIAYGKTSQRFSTGNTGTITAEEIARQPVNNPLLAMQGRVPGLIITQSSGVPGGGITIRIQGRNNLSTAFTNSDPLIVVDGVPYPSQNLKTFFGGRGNAILGNSANAPDNQSAQVTYGSPLSYLNPSDIESITILKDADATSIYGSRAANGAVLITTKKSRSGQNQVDINIQQGWGKIARKMDLLNSPQYMEMRREAKKNDNLAVSTADYDLRGLWDTTRYTDWQKELIGNTAHYNRGTASLSGGNNITQYLISTSYGKETTVFPGDFANTKKSLHFFLRGGSINQKFKAQLTGTFMADKNELPGEDFTQRALGLPPVAPALYKADGTLNWAPVSNANNNSSWLNPLSNLYNLFDNNTDNLISNLTLSYSIIPGLEIKSSFGYNSLNTDQFAANLNGSVKPELRTNRNRSAYFTFNSSKSWIVEPQITYQFSRNSHKLNVLLGSTFQELKNEGRAFTASGQPSDQLLRDMQSARLLEAATPDISTYRYSAIFARLNYNLKDKYIFNLTARRDGSSRFGNQNMFNNFGSAGVAWIFTQEEWLKNAQRILSFGKLRASYGTTGNDQIGNYQYMSLFNSLNTGIPYQDVSALMPSRLSNPKLAWEETKKFQAGIEMGFFLDRLLANFTYIRNRTSNTLLTVELPISVGYEDIADNLAATIQNSGWELLLSADIIRSSAFTWSSSLNMTILKNKLVDFPGLETSIHKNTFTIGQPLGILKTFEFYGVDPSTGLYLIKDRNGNPTSQPDNILDRTKQYNLSPQLYGGFQNSFNYKGFQLDFLFQYSLQDGYHILELPGAVGRMNVATTNAIGNQTRNVLKRWRKEGDVTIYQRYTTLSAVWSATSSGDRNIKNSSYARLKNLSLSYQLPSEITNNLHLKNCRIFVNVQNLLTLTSYEGLDPETMSITNLPPLRMIAVGLQVTF